MRTITIGEVGSNYEAGWHELTIRTAKYGKHDESPYIDVWFEDYPDNFNMRTWAKTSDNGEEWCVARLFRFANAGIVEALDEGGQKRATLNDDAEQLIGKKINILFFKELNETDGKEYGRAYLVPAPTVFTNVVETFTEANVASLKKAAVDNWRKMGKGTLPEHVLNGVHTNGISKEHSETVTITTEEDEKAAVPPF
jgi:hypothetical protein